MKLNAQALEEFTLQDAIPPVTVSGCVGVLGMVAVERASAEWIEVAGAVSVGAAIIGVLATAAYGIAAQAYRRKNNIHRDPY